MMSIESGLPHWKKCVECKNKNSYENMIILFLSMLIKKLSFQSELNYNVLLWIQGQSLPFLAIRGKKLLC